MSDRSSHKEPKAAHLTKVGKPTKESETPVTNQLVYTTVGSHCENIKSKKQPTHRCENPATHGHFCGIHYKKPVPFVKGVTTLRKARKLNKLSLKKAEEDASKKIGEWLLQAVRHWNIRRCSPPRSDPAWAPVFYLREQLANDTDFFSTEPLKEVSPPYFFAYSESKQFYGFDLRSIYTILHRARSAGEPPLNPYNRSPIPASVAKHIRKRVDMLERRGISVSWVPLDPPTPEQQTRMRIVDLFSKIDDLHYYSSPDWFLELNIEGHRQFYRELYAIWTHRAGLTNEQKTAIVPDYTSRLFRIPSFAVVDMTMDTLQRTNVSVIRLMISSAEDRNDRILGAMYVVSTLTLVHRDARAAYPWLYESVYEAPLPRVLPPIYQVGWFHRLFGSPRPRIGTVGSIPLLELPPPHPE